MQLQFNLLYDIMYSFPIKTEPPLFLIKCVRRVFVSTFNKIEETFILILCNRVDKFVYNRSFIVTLSMSKKQKTMQFFGFSKNVVHRGKIIEVDIGDEVQDADKILCEYCSKKFKTKQGLAIHRKCIHLVTEVYINKEREN